MDTFSTVDALWRDALSQIINNGSVLPSRDGPTREILGYTARLSDPRAHFLFDPIRQLSPAYAAAELLWFLSGQRVVHALVPYAPQYTRFCNEGELFLDEDGNESHPLSNQWKVKGRNVLYAHGAYGYRLNRRFGGASQLENIISMLQSDPVSRQAVVTLYDAEMDQLKATRGDKKDIPCTLSLNFILRNGKLNCQGTMRSNDIWLGLPHDIWAFTSIQLLVAEALGVEVGWYQHSAMSLHLYDRNMQKASQVMQSDGDYDKGPMTYTKHTTPNIFEAFPEAVRLEAENRYGGYLALPDPFIGWGSLLGHAVLMAASKWVPDKRILLKHIGSPIMADYMEKYWC